VNYEWDPDKAKANRQHHGVSFVEAATVLEDEAALTREDPNAEGEQRYVPLALVLLGVYWSWSIPTESQMSFD
jgi:uncharacterized protein